MPTIYAYTYAHVPLLQVAALELENTELKKKLGSQHSAEDDKTLAEKTDLHARCSDCEQAKEKQRLELERLKAENAKQKQEMERQKAEMRWPG